MKTSFRFYSTRMIYFLAFILCTQVAIPELNASHGSTYQTIEDFEVEQKIDQLLLLIQKRLVIMHEVARTKWNQNLPIEDKIREEQILADLADLARQYDLDEKWITKFFHAQIDASKEIQKNDYAIWQKEGVLKFEGVFSLKNELRSYINQLNHEMMMLFSKINMKNFNLNKFVLDKPISTRYSDYIENDVWLLAILPLKN